MNDHRNETPTVVLVHGALAGTSVWTEVIRGLQAKGVPVLAPALPLRGLASDGAYLGGVLDAAPGPVLLVGHSYAGQVISLPLGETLGAKVRALVYLAAFQPDAGETAGELNARFPGSRLGPDTVTVLPRPGGQDLYLRPEAFREVYAGDVAPATSAVMAAAQRPIDPAAMDEPLPGEPAWRDRPSWSLVATRDHSIPADALRFMAARAGSHTVEVDSSHAVPVSHPDAVIDLILTALDTINSPGAIMNIPKTYPTSVSVPLPSDEQSRSVFEAALGGTYDPDTTLNVVRMFTGTEGMFTGVIGLVRKIFGPDGIDDAKRRQMIILRVAKNLDAPYEWQANAVMAHNAGLTDAEIAAAASDGPVTGVAPEYVLVGKAVDELTRTHSLTDQTLTELLDRYGEVGTRKHILSIAFFTMIGLWLNGCRVPLETTDKVGTNTSPLG